MAAPPESPGRPCPGGASDASYREQAVLIDCEGDTLVGIASIPARPGPRGILVIVGGPQYRAGSHRQFVLLARDLAQDGIPVLRFDYRGMGDSAGGMRNFEQVGADIARALDQFTATVPSLQDVAVWGMCDGAAAAAFHAPLDPRVVGMVLLNPWVRTDGGIARTTLRHYYRARLFDRALWGRILRGRFDYRAALRSLAGLLSQAAGGTRRAGGSQPALPDRLLSSLAAFPGRILVILSGQDLTAREFMDLAGSSAKWKRALGPHRTGWRHLEEADHTFSCRAWRDQVARWTREWVRSW
ncbi:hydrolase 1, exosortase A system-associated [Pseudoduganella sp. GCM10020061]|uniref:hydrolase 1, exosortase A system-associated n=1 Tax=Pseudoduganella sp. GCM10020061 TaxID=3317345 RepID=UPI00363BE01F